MLMLGPGARRPFPGRDHRPPVTRQPEVPAELHPVVTRSDFKTRQTVSRVTRGMVRQAAAVGKATSRCKEVTMAPGHGMINDSQGKRPLVLRPVIGIWMVATPERPTLSITTANGSVDARARGPTLSSPGPGQLETRLEVIVW